MESGKTTRGRDRTLGIESVGSTESADRPPGPGGCGERAQISPKSRNIANSPIGQDCWTTRGAHPDCGNRFRQGAGGTGAGAGSPSTNPTRGNPGSRLGRPTQGQVGPACGRDRLLTRGCFLLRRRQTSGSIGRQITQRTCVRRWRWLARWVPHRRDWWAAIPLWGTGLRGGAER